MHLFQDAIDKVIENTEATEDFIHVNGSYVVNDVSVLIHYTVTITAYMATPLLVDKARSCISLILIVQVGNVEYR